MKKAEHKQKRHKNIFVRENTLPLLSYQPVEDTINWRKEIINQDMFLSVL